MSDPIARMLAGGSLCVGTVRWPGVPSSLDVQANRLVRMTLLGMFA
jgi:hypothetical protein